MTPNDRLTQLLVETFNIELESLLNLITDNLNKYSPNQSTLELKNMMEEISRSGRNIKVSAYSVGIEDVGRIAELIEKLFDPIRKLNEELIHLIFKAVDEIRNVMHHFVEKKPAVNISELLIQLQEHLDNQEVKEKQIEEKSSSSPVNDSFQSTSGLDNELMRKIFDTFKAEFHDNLITITNGLLQLEKGTKTDTDFQNLLNELFRLAHNIKGSARGIGVTHVGEIAHHLENLFEALQKNKINISSDLINLCLQSIDYMNEALQCYQEEKPLTFDIESYLLKLELYQEDTSKTPVSKKEIKSLAPQKFSALQIKNNEFESIRVSLQNLDQISVYMEEIQAIKILIEEYYFKINKINFRIDHLVQSKKKNTSTLEYADLAELSEINNTSHLIQREFRIPISELSSLLNSLQDEIRTLRLIPVSNQLRYLPRLIRDLAHDLDKKVNVEIKHNEVKIDKLILDGIKDPIVHILRNAIDHGIESAPKREQEGKPAQGNITIDVTQEDNQIVFQITDDGAGINPEDLKRIALQKKIISPDEFNTMKQEDIYELIFHPGFSTRTVATDISGRGVGLDVVRSNLLHLKGQVSVESTLGKGTSFFLRVPLTLATEQGLIVSCSNQLFVIITSFVDSVLLITQQDIVEVEGNPTVIVKDQPVFLCSLSQILHLQENTKTNIEPFSVVVIKKNGKSIALLVDEIIGEREIILKPLQEPLTNIPCVIGATLTSSNQINFVLNSSEIIKRILL